MTEQRISELTVDELVALIRKTVQEAMVEVLIEFSVAAQHDADVVYQAEMTDMLRAALQKGLNFDSEEAPLSDD